MGNEIDIIKKGLNETQIAKAKEMSASMDVSSTNSVIQYGADIQKKLGNYSDDILRNVKEGNDNEISGHINELLSEIYDIDVEGNSFLSKVPVLNKFVKTTKKMLMKYDSTKSNIDKISLKLDKSHLSLLQDNETLNGLYEKNYEYINELAVYVLAAEEKVADMKAEIEEMEKNGGDMYEIADKRDILVRLERKVIDLKTSGTIAMQTLPQIRAIQNNNAVLVEKIQTSITTTIPVWKNQFVLAATLDKQKRAVAIQKKLSDATNKMVVKNSQTMAENAQLIARENEKSVVDIETLKKANETIITTLKEIKKIKIDGASNREKMERELKIINDQLKNEILNN